MEEEELSESGLPQITSIMNRVRDLKNKYRNEDNITDELNCTKISADTTGMFLLRCCHVCNKSEPRLSERTVN